MQEAVRQTDPWTKDYELGKWVPTYLAMLEEMERKRKSMLFSGNIGSIRLSDDITLR